MAASLEKTVLASSLVLRNAVLVNRLLNHRLLVTRIKFHPSSLRTSRFCARISFVNPAKWCIFFPQRRLLSGKPVKLVHECWKCGSDLDPEGQQYFCECGVVQPPKICRDYFCMLGLEREFDIDLKELKKTFTDLQRELHPDKFTQKSETEKEFSLQQSSKLNKAYSTLLKPLPRALYMLELEGVSIEESTISADPEFLMEIMEINEKLAEAESLEDVEKIGEENQKVLDSLTKELSFAFEKDDLDEAKNLLSQLKYYANIDEKVKELQQLYVDKM